MSRYAFSLAEPEDDAQLRACMAAVWMEGRMALSFRREPNYFAGCRLQGDAVQVMKCVDRNDGHIVGMGSRSTVRMHANGVPTRLGYLADLRALPETRPGTLLARGYQFLRLLHARDPVPYYLSVIFDDNQRALGNLVGGRAGLPVYTPVGRMRTPAIPFDFARRRLQVEHTVFERGACGSMEEITAFLSAQLPHKQWSPVVDAADFAAGARLHDLRARDFFVAKRHGRIVGCIAAWDQSNSRQTHIERYSAALELLRPFINLASKLLPYKPLPAPGGRIAHLYLCLAAVVDNDLPTFRALLRHAYNALRQGPWHYAVLGLHARDPLAAVFDDYRCIDAGGQLFTVHYPQDGDPHAAFDGRVPGFDMAFA